MSHSKTVYIAGPMTGLPEYNYPAFFAAEDRFIAAGWTVLNPARHDASWITDDMDPDEVRAKFMQIDIEDVMRSDAIALLPGWEASKGANTELSVARILMKEVLDAETLDPYKDPSLKPTNPKDAIGSDKLPLHLWPETATLLGCLGLLEGALKYGRNNWRETGVRTSIYIDAVKRHINAYAEGEDFDPDSGLPHLSHALACLAIIVDAGAAAMLNDDRNYPGGYRSLVSDLTPHVSRLKVLHADKDPKHWTIADARETQ